MNKDIVKTFADKVYADMAGAMGTGMAYIGVKMGLFRAMQGRGPMQASEVIDATGLQARYVEEWLKGMTASGYLRYDSDADAYLLPQEHAFLLASEGTDHFMGGLFYFAAALLGVAPKVADAFRTGGGVRFEEFGPECVTALDMINSGQRQSPRQLLAHQTSRCCPTAGERRPCSRFRLRRRARRGGNREGVSQVRGCGSRSRP
jgi:hypothetical protein